MTAILLWWVLSARKWFKGPKVNVQHQMLSRTESITGQDVKADLNDGSSGSEDGLHRTITGKDPVKVPGQMPEGMQGGDMKPHGL